MPQKKAPKEAFFCDIITLITIGGQALSNKFEDPDLLLLWDSKQLQNIPSNYLNPTCKQ